MPRSGRNYDGWLKDYKPIREWYDSVALGSEITAEVYMRRLWNFCEKNNMKTPLAILKMKPKAIESLLLANITRMKADGNKPDYIQSHVKAIRSFLKHNDIDTKKIPIRGANQPKDETIPTIKELRRILLSSNKRIRAATILIAHGGLRPQVMGNHKGTDGLRIGDLPEMEISKDGTVSFKTIPTLVIVRAELSKTGKKYFTFLSGEGCEYLKDYIEERMASKVKWVGGHKRTVPGEKLTPESPLIKPLYLSTDKKNKGYIFNVTNNISEKIKAAMKKAGYEGRPYVLRSFFDTQLMVAESKGQIINSYRRFFMGHGGDMDATYTVNRGKLPPTVIEDMRTAYQRSQEHLQTTGNEPSNEKLEREAKRAVLVMMGYTPEDIDKEGLLDKPIEDLVALVSPTPPKMNTTTVKEQKAIPADEVPAALRNGWLYVASLPNGMVIVERHKEP